MERLLVIILLSGKGVQLNTWSTFNGPSCQSEIKLSACLIAPWLATGMKYNFWDPSPSLGPLHKIWQNTVRNCYWVYLNVAQETSHTLCNRVRLHIPIIVLAGPDKASFRFQGLSNHVINEPMFIPDLLGFKLGLVFSGKQKSEHPDIQMKTGCTVCASKCAEWGVWRFKKKNPEEFSSSLLFSSSSIVTANASLFRIVGEPIENLWLSVSGDEQRNQM